MRWLYESGAAIKTRRLYEHWHMSICCFHRSVEMMKSLVRVLLLWAPLQVIYAFQCKFAAFVIDLNFVENGFIKKSRKPKSKSGQMFLLHRLEASRPRIRHIVYSLQFLAVSSHHFRRIAWSHLLVFRVIQGKRFHSNWYLLKQWIMHLLNCRRDRHFYWLEAHSMHASTAFAYTIRWQWQSNYKEF